MDWNDLPNHLRRLADEELRILVARLPSRAEAKIALLLEIQRVMDTWMVHREATAQPVEHLIGFIDILRHGLNLATAHLLVQMPSPGIPLRKPDPNFRRAAEALLHSFGRVTLARRAADMVQHGLLVGELDKNLLTLRDAGSFSAQFMDHVEFDLLEKAEDSASKGESSHGWTVLDEEATGERDSPGAFWKKTPREIAPRYSMAELEGLMLPLLRPWVMPFGTMMEYDGSPELDDHFVDEVANTMAAFVDFSGIHPDVQFDGFTAGDLFKVVASLMVIYRKHVVFGLVAKRNIPEIAVEQSLTIWEPIVQLADAVSNFNGMSRATTQAALRAITVEPSDVEHLKSEKTPLLPMLIDLGNGYAIRPISSLFRNPLSAFQTITKWRDPSSRNRIAAHREDWLRSEVYSIFGGKRYFCVPGNVALRRGKVLLTDVDAAVFDRTNGELALFQLKWQDYTTSDVRELRSKTKNLSVEVESWAENVCSWIFDKSPEEVTEAFRLQLQKPKRITSIFLFVISRDVARTHGYGFPISNPHLSIASWAQFRRLRLQLGPRPQVLSSLHEILRTEEGASPAGIVPLPVSIQLQGLDIKFENLWNTWDEDLSPDPEA